MNKLDRQAQMMDYLYGEMTAEARREYEHWLEQHPEVQQEIAELQTGRDWLAEAEDITPRPMMINLETKSGFDRKWLYRMGAAAAVLLAFWLFNFQVRTDESGLLLSFGHPKSTASVPPELPAADASVQVAALEQLLAGNQQLLQEKISGMDSTWTSRFATLQNENQRRWRELKTVQAGQVQQVKQEFTQEQLPRLADLLQQLQTEQQKELQLLLVELWNTWEETRQNDLQRIDFKLTNLYQNAELNQQASEARVVDYIQQVAGR